MITAQAGVSPEAARRQVDRYRSMTTAEKLACADTLWNLAPEFYCAPVEAIAAEAQREAFGHFNVIHVETGARADVYLAGKDALARRGLAERRTVQLLGRTVPVAAPEYVIRHKLRFRQQGASDRHLRDIRTMLRVLGTTIDQAALERDAVALGLSDQWREMQEGLD